MKKSLKIINIFIVFILFTQILFSQVRRINFQKEQETKAQNQQTEEILQTNSIIDARIAKRKQLEKSIVDLGVLDKTINDSLYTLGPGDILSVNIISARPIYFEMIVSPEGKVDIPGLSTINLQGLTLKDGKEKIKKILDSKFINAEIFVQLVEIKLVKIFLTGAVVTPGATSVKASERVIDVLMSSGGIDDLGKMYNIELIREDTVTINGYNYLLHNDMSSNPYVKAGDVIYVPKADPYSETIMVRGATQKSGVYPIQKGEKLSSFLIRYNNFGKDIKISEINITRYKGKEKKLFRIDMDKKSNSKYDMNFKLKPGDILEFPMILEVYVQGFVNVPGAYPFVSGYNAIDYVGLAGGNSESGNPKKVIIFRENGEKLKGFHIPVERGDVIIVPPSVKYSLFDQTGVFGMISTLTSIILAVVVISK